MNKKYELDLFSFYDYTGIEQHFEKRASEGWLIENNFWGFFIYKKIEPKYVKFYVSYSPTKYDEYEPNPSEEEIEFRDLVEYTGWTFVMGTVGRDVFYNESRNPKPIETEPILKVENVHSKNKKQMLIWIFFIFLMQIVNYGSIRNIIKDPIKFMSDYADINKFLFAIIATVFFILYFTNYYSWKKRATMLADIGEFVDTDAKKLRIGMIIAGIIYICNLILNLVMFGADSEIMHEIFLWLGIMVISSIHLLVIKYLKNKEGAYSVDEIKKISSWVHVVLMVGLFIVINHVDFFERDMEQTLKKMPYTIEEIKGEKSGYIFPLEMSYSIFSNFYELGQSNDEVESDVWFYYKQTLVKMPFLYDYYKNVTLQGRDDLELIEDSAWEANEVYRSGKQGYLLFYDDKIIEFSITFDVSDEMKHKIGAKANA